MLEEDPTVAESQEANGAPARAVIGRRVKDLRLARGMTLRQFAGLLGVSPATLSAIENGHTGISSVRLAQAAAVLDAPVEDLFSAESTGARPSRPASETAVPVQAGPGPGRPTPLDWRAYPPLDLDPPLAAALSAFLEFGYHGATMRHVAQLAGLSVPGVYHYYASKQDMLVAILDMTMEDLLARSLAAKAEGRDAVERFSLLIECLALFHTHRRELGFVGASEMRGLEPESRERVATARRQQQRLVDEEVEQATVDGTFATRRPHEAARAVVTMCTALPQWYCDNGPAPAEEVAEQYVQFALDLVCCTRARRSHAASWSPGRAVPVAHPAVRDRPTPT